MTARFGAISERELDIAESVFRWTLRRVEQVAKDFGMPGTVITGAMLRAQDTRERLRKALEAEEVAT